MNILARLPFNPKEWLIISISSIISALILSSLIWLEPTQQGINPYTLLAYNTQVIDARGEKLDPFYTIFFANYEAKAPEHERQLVSEILQTEVQRLHPYADRHHDFFDAKQSEYPLENWQLLTDDSEDHLITSQGIHGEMVLTLQDAAFSGNVALIQDAAMVGLGEAREGYLQLVKGKNYRLKVVAEASFSTEVVATLKKADGTSLNDLDARMVLTPTRQTFLHEFSLDGVNETVEPTWFHLDLTPWASTAQLHDTITIDAIKLEEKVGNAWRDSQQIVNGEMLAYLFNLKRLNLAYGQPEWQPIDRVFYQLLLEAKELTKFTNGSFNMFLGTVIDFWDARLNDFNYRYTYREDDPAYNPRHRQELMRRLARVPMTAEEVDATLELKIENDQPYVRFNALHGAGLGDVKISLGALAKGFANDLFAEQLFAEGLTRGYISNGTSSITTMGPRYGNEPYRWQLTSPHPSAEFAMVIEKPGRHSLSTSGAYTGFYMPVGNGYRLRHHIIDPKTGYPSQQAIELNVISSRFSAGGLDALSTAFMTMNKEEAMTYRAQLIAEDYDLEIAWVEVIDQRVHVTYTDGYENFLQRQSGVIYHRY